MFKNLWKKIKAWLLVKWNTLKAWFIAKPWVWVKKNYFMIANYFVIVLTYNNIYGKEGVTFAEVLLGLWIFTSIAHAGWKWFNRKKI